MTDSGSFYEEIGLTGRKRWKGLERYEFYSPEFGRGDASLVYLAKDNDNLVAIKSYASRWIFDNEKILETEINSFNKLHSLGLVPKLLRKPFRTKNSIHLILEFFNCGSLDLYIKKEKAFPPNIIQDITRFLAEALCELEKIPMVHREINPRHILVSRDKNGKVTYKLTGLHFCKNIANRKPASFVGTPEYTAPETAAEIEYDCKADVWSLGATLYEIAMLSTPQKVDQNFRAAIKKGSIPEFPADAKIVPALYDLICKCLAYDPSKRPCAGEILNHPFLTTTPVPEPMSITKEIQKISEKKKSKEKHKSPKSVPKREKLDDEKLLQMISGDFAEYMKYVNETEDYSIKLKCEKRDNLDPYVGKDLKPLDCGGATNPSNRGGFSEIYFCTNSQTGVKYALKIVKTSKMTDVKIAELLLGEVLIMLELTKCPFAIQIKDYFVYRNDLCLVLEYCNGGDLDNYIRRLRRKRSADFPLEELKLVAWNVACGLNEMHKLKMMHRDIKPKNILVIEDPNTKALIDIKLCDYGLSKKVSEYQELNGSTILGTFDYFAPELYEMMEKKMEGDITEMTYDYKIDVWSYGILLYFTLYGKTPMEPPGSKTSVMRQKKILYPNLKGVPESYYNLIKRALTYDPVKRPSFAELLTDPFFSVVVLQPRLKTDPYVKGESLANSSNKKVSVYKCKKDEDTFVMKIIDSTGIEKKRLLSEIDTLTKLKNSKNVVRLYDYFAIENMVHLILEYYEGGDLENYVLKRESKKKSLSKDEQKLIAYSVLNGINDIHGHNIIHRDIHPRNILLSVNEEKEINNAIISGFGYARILLDEEASTQIFTAYKSPEMTSNSGTHDSKTDIWSYGMLLYFLIFGIHPDQHPGNHNLAAIFKKGEVKYDEKRAKNSKSLLKLMKECLKVKPKDRPSAADLLKSSAFKQFTKH